MHERALGRLTVSTVGLGCNQFARKIDREASTRVVHAALDSGVTFFDTSDRYGYGDRPYSGHGRSEEFLGHALRGRRDQAQIATKFGLAVDGTSPRPRASRSYTRAACDASLRRLGTDHIDLYLLHRPDPDTPVEETLGALDDLVAAGKVLEIGWSNVSAEQVRHADDAANAAGVGRFAAVQNEYSLLRRDAEDDVLPACAERGLAFVPYFPLASGLLTGKYRRDEAPPADARLAGFAPNRPHLGLTDANLRAADALRAFAADAGRDIVELAISWLLARPQVASVIAGATTPDQVIANAAAGRWQLSAAELAVVDEILAASPGDPPLG